MLLIHLSYQIMAESEEELKSLLMKVKEESEKADLKLNIQKTKIMASSPITSWQIGREDVETMSDFILFSSKITAGGDCSHKIKRSLLLKRIAMTNLDSVLKSRDITFLTKAKVKSFSLVWLFATPWTGAYQDPPSMGFSRQEYWSGLPFPSPGDLPNPGIEPRSPFLTKVLIFKAMVFPVVVYGYESWTIKRTECGRIDAFKLQCWRRLLRVPWTARRSNQSILRKSTLNMHWKNWCWSRSSNTLATWWRSQLTRKVPSARKDCRQEEKGMTEDGMVGWHLWLDGHEFEQASGVGDGQGTWHAAIMGSQRIGHDFETKQQPNKHRSAA